jgi:HJR/Mrr/RecB family endonuclease
MLARFEWRTRHPNNLRPSGNSYQTAKILLVIIVGLFLGWLIYHYVGRPAWISGLPPFLVEVLTLLESASSLTIALVFALLFWRIYWHKKLATQVVTTEDLYALSPAAFERYVANLFRKKGYQVTVRGRSGDHGVDLELERPGDRRAIVQCKRYRNAIGPDIVRELFGTMIHEGVNHAFLVTTADISPAARDWARNKPMTLIDGQMLVKIADSLLSRKSEG